VMDCNLLQVRQQAQARHLKYVDSDPLK
jgi:hypothetical protein